MLLLALALTVLPPHFADGPGWAATVRLRDCADCIPHRTLAALPPGGIVIQLTVARERPLYGPAGTWPPRIRRTDVSAGMEGVPSRYGVVQMFVRTGVRERFLWVWFGRARPTARQLARANAQLRSVR